MTNPWLGMPTIAGASTLYSIVKDLNAKPAIQRQNNATFTTIPDHLVQHIAYGNHQEVEVQSKFYTHTRFKHLRGHLRLSESVGVVMAYRMRFTLVTLDRNSLSLAFRKEFKDAQIKPPSPDELRDARAKVYECQEKIRRMVALEQQTLQQHPVKETRSWQVTSELKVLRHEILSVQMEMAKEREVIKNAKTYVGASGREDQIKALSRQPFIANFVFELIEPQQFSTGLKGTGTIGIDAMKSLQPDAKIGVNFMWNEEHFLGTGGSWAGTVQVFLNQGRLDFDGTGKFFERFRENWNFPRSA
ncbi:hypothetical protein ACFY2H_39145 [Streptomyces griseofuscus]|uniref:hypothetical protein n=1 Tax=Streptomyces griseofuscus TaxID=146922 RepID=UPI0036BEEF3F